MAKTIARLAMAWVVVVAAARAQTPSLQDLQNKLLQFEESTQKAIADLKAQIAALQQVQKPSSAVPPAHAAPPSTPTPPASDDVAVVHTPTEYYGEETRTDRQAGDNEDGAPRIDNEPLDPELLGFFHIPGTSTYMKFGRLREDRLLI